MRIQWSLLLAACLCSAAVIAQNEADAPAAPVAPTPVPAAAPAAVATPDVAEAYRREYAFLEAQKRELQQRLEETRSRALTERQRLEGEIDRFEGQVVSLTARADDLRAELNLADEQAQVNLDNAGLLAATLAQADATLEGLGVEEMKTPEFEALGEIDKVQRAFAIGNEQIAELSTLRRSPGAFFLQDGTEVTGTIVRVGNIAAFGVSDAGAGALAPAGGGRLKLWQEPTSETAQALAAGQIAPTLRMFLYESLNTAVSDKTSQTVIEHIHTGGVIGWVIVVMGLFAVLLSLLRAFFLRNASAATGILVEAVAPSVQAGKLDQAIDICKQNKGSTARVLTATLRNLDRDREHLEDIISEAILHESARLNRFGSVILVIAAVAPLLGLLGTVTGMIATFDVITEFGTSDPKLLAGGIAIALTTTELGLIVAIPALLAGNLLSGWADGIKDDMEKGALRITNVYTARGRVTG